MEKVANRSHLRQLVSWLIIIIELFLLFLSACSTEIPPRKILKHGDSNPQEVRLQITDNKVVIDNGIVEVTIENPSGYLIGIKYKGMENVLDSRHRNKNKGYWDIVSDHCPVDQIVTKHVKVITQTDDLVELSFTKKWNFTTDYHKNVPLNIDKRFIVRRGVPGLYMYGIFERQEDFPDAHMNHIRIVFKLREDKFRFMVLSDTRQRIMPSGDDRSNTRSQILAYKEAVLLTNPSDPQLRGEVDDKYQYSSENKDNKLHGWISDDDTVGFWIITPSSEFKAGGPHKQGLTSHPGPTALSMLVTAHYAGKDLDTAYKKGEHWKKVFGPVFIYVNSASSDDDYRKTLWNGPTLWEIGIPDRTAAEFFIPEPDPIFVNSLCLDDADKFRQYGLWERYSDIYRHGDLVYTVGASNYSRDWFFAHVLRNIGNSTNRPTTWQIKYNLQDVNEEGTYTLQLALAAASFAEVQVRFNNPNAVRPYFRTGRIGYDNAVARHAIHGLYRLYSINVPGNRFQKGDNTIFLTQTRSQGSYTAVMYDYIRLEGPTV